MAATFFNSLVLTLLFLHCFFMVDNLVLSDDEEDSLLQGINRYRASLNLTSLTKNENAECFAGKIADKFKNQPCTNTTGSNTVQGTEPQFTDYTDLLAKCHLNIVNAKEGMIMPACVPSLVPSIVLSNYTETQYSGYLNDSKYVSAGISSENNWMVVVLTTDTTGGNFVTYNAASLVSKVGLIHLFSLLGCLFVISN